MRILTSTAMRGIYAARIQTWCCFLVVFFFSGFACAQVYLLDEQFNGAPAVPATLTGVGGPFGSTAANPNYGRNAPAIQFTSSGQRLTYGPWTGTADHISFFHKGNAGAASTILVEESPDGVVWSTIGTCTAITTSATWDGPIGISSQYVRLTFTLSGANKPYIDDLRIRAKTTLCIQPPQIIQLLVNGGCAACEDANEFVYFNTGGQPLDISYFELVNPFVIAGGASYGGNGPADNLNTNWVTAGAYNAYQMSYISNLNLWSTCTNVFVPVPAGNIIPANAPVIAITGAAPDAIYNLSNLCALGTVYVMFSTRNNCPTNSGKYANASCSANCTRFVTIFNHQTGCLDNQQYSASSSTTADGDMYIFNGGSVGYTFNVPCAAVILPVDLISFEATNVFNGIELIWKANNEDHVLNYEIERSSNGYDFNKIGVVHATGISSVQTYSYLDESPSKGLNYYRLSVLDENGEESNSDVIAANYAKGNNLIEISKYNNQIRISSCVDMRNAIVSCYSAEGKLMQNVRINLRRNEPQFIELPDARNTFLIVSVTSDQGHWVNRIITN